MTEYSLMVDEVDFLCTKVPPRDVDEDKYEMDSATFENTRYEIQMPIVTDKAEVYYTAKYDKDSLDMRMHGGCPLCGASHTAILEPQELAQKTEVSLEDAKSLMPE